MHKKLLVAKIWMQIVLPLDNGFHSGGCGVMHCTFEHADELLTYLHTVTIWALVNGKKNTWLNENAAVWVPYASSSEMYNENI